LLLCSKSAATLPGQVAVPFAGTGNSPFFGGRAILAAGENCRRFSDEGALPLFLLFLQEIISNRHPLAAEILEFARRERLQNSNDTTGYQRLAMDQQKSVGGSSISCPSLGHRNYDNSI
jgi:hypothetical protein